MAKQVELGWVEYGSAVKVNGFLYKVERMNRDTKKMILTPLKHRDEWQPTAPCPIEMKPTDIVERA